MKDSKQMDFFPSTSSQEDTLANLSLSQVIKKVSKIRDTSGQKCLDLSKSSDRLGLLEKTLVDTLNSVSTPYSRTWRVKVTPQGRLVFQLRASVRTTKESESGLWRTPDNMAGGSNLPGIQKALDEGHLKRPSGQSIQIRLADQVRDPRLWPTPKASGQEKLKTLIKRKGIKEAVKHNLTAAVEMWPTPVQADVYHRKTKYKQGGTAVSTKAGGTLNPTWVEWLMGYPSGWTDLSVSETASSHKSPTTSEK